MASCFNVENLAEFLGIRHPSFVLFYIYEGNVDLEIRSVGLLEIIQGFLMSEVPTSLEDVDAFITGLMVISEARRKSVSPLTVLYALMVLWPRRETATQSILQNFTLLRKSLSGS